MNALKLGSFLIPIVETYEPGRAPQGTLPYQLPNNEKKAITNADAQYYYGLSSSYAQYTAYTGPSSTSHDIVETYTLGASSIDLHDGYNSYEIGDKTQTGGANFPIHQYAWPSTWRVNNTPAYTANAPFISGGIANWPPVNSVYHKADSMCAIRIKYSDDSPYSYQLVKTGISQEHTPTTDNTTYSITSTYAINVAYWRRLGYECYIEEVEIPGPDEPPFDPSEPENYTPTIDDSSDLIDLPSDPTIGVTNAGFINVYRPSAGALQGLGDILFPNVATATDVMDAILKLCETLANQNLINYVIDCHVVPGSPVTGSNSNIKVGFRDTGISVPTVVSDYVNISCGSLNIAEYFGGFADYMATRSKIYLPFVGFVDTKPEYWQAGTIAVDYKFNIIDGSFMAYIRSASSKSQLNMSVIAQYAGNACMHFPLTGVNYSNMVSGLVGAGISAASAGTSTAVLGSALSASNTIAQGGSVQQSNPYNSTAAILGVRTPYMIIERPVPSYSSGYMHEVGYPSNIYAKLSDISGFTTIDDIDLSGIPLTQTELEELRGLLKEGVYF